MPHGDSGNQKWREIFGQRHILETVASDGRAFLTADEINQTIGVSLEQARTLCKIDYRQAVPDIMAEHDMSILATANGKYCIGPFDPFVGVPPIRFGTAIEKTLPAGCDILRGASITSESRALDTALHSGMLHDVFGEDALLTIRGRTYSTGFTLPLEMTTHGTMMLAVRGVQLEVDGGYESPRGIHLIEAKMNALDNVSIRQVLYPLLHWEAAVADLHLEKRVYSYLLTYDSPWFKFTPFVWDGNRICAEPNGQKVFSLHEDRRLDLAASLQTSPRNLTDPSVPFPQANDLDKVLTMLTLIGSSDSCTPWDLIRDFGIDIRQIYYYVAVLRWMRLCTRDSVVEGSALSLTDEGRRLFSMSRIARLQEMAKIVFSDPIARAGLSNMSALEDAAVWSAHGMALSANTRGRRAQTIRQWIRYFRAVEAESFC